ncbi:MAG: membrane protein insertion efficiency factor YidD [Candidatus Margulisbacteria bacterium]|nr:membrane protein insertion efficiency factor YidD [Candidatus Margulisiibacteriota bacterium]
MARIAIYLLKIYQKLISPLLRAQCRHYPTCSNYMIEAIEVHGLTNGVKYGIKRLLTCNQFFKGGYDPVPALVSRETKWSN